ncbi:hypothetical protein LY474_24545 [Myxococcus stipitatus]|uniref:SMI1/KNR4 family protein n=1 Tax=Myxococcus stipitatus TaxID=83455 RepID=UPI001F3A7B74|nr:SMI1/KNR4 family protein [Myxococcus stipitatus]MCE9670983.1 hypothetical protein [Myxococcus stipitatus]
MHEWLEALRKSAKAASSGVSADEVRWAETECGVPFPEELGQLYLTFNGGELHGDVHLFPLHGPEGTPSVLEKSRLKLVGLPAAGVWRIGLKGPHRHIFSARKSAMVEQGDGGGPLPEWVQTLGDEDWVFGTWDGEQRQMRLYRSLKDMLDVLVPPAEVESFGERTFARAMNAVLQGALSGVEVEDEDADEEAEFASAEAVGEPLVEAEDEAAAQRELAYEYDEDVAPRARTGANGSPVGAKVAARAGKPGLVTQTELFNRPSMREALSKELGAEKKVAVKKFNEPKAKAAKPAPVREPAPVKVEAKQPVSEPVEAEAGSVKGPAQKADEAMVSSKEVIRAAKSAVAKAGTGTAVAEKAKAKPEEKTSGAVAPAVTKTAAKKAATRAPTVKPVTSTKPTAKKAAVKAPSTKPVATKPAAKMATAPSKKPAAKKVAVTKPAAKKAAVPVAKKSAAKKATTKAAAKKGSVKKVTAFAAKKTPAAVAKKPAAKKATTKAAAKKPAKGAARKSSRR